LEEAMDAIENGTTSLRKASTHWNILLISLSSHLYKKTRSRKLGVKGVLTTKEDQGAIAWVLAM